MIQLTKLTIVAYQSFKLRGEKGEEIAVELRYAPRMKRWMMNISYLDFNLPNGAMLANAPNILRNYRKNIPFGILCTSTDGFDPAYLDDFISVGNAVPRVTLCLLNSDEVKLVESEFYTNALEDAGS